MSRVEERVKQINNAKSKEIDDKLEEVKKEREILQNVMGLQDSFLTNQMKHSRSDVDVKSMSKVTQKKVKKNKDLELEGILVEFSEENLLDGLSPGVSPNVSKLRSPFNNSTIAQKKKKFDFPKKHLRNKSSSVVQPNTTPQNNSSAGNKSNFAAISIESFEIFK